MKKVLLCILAMGVAGCGTAAPYASVGVGYQVDQNSDWYVRTERDWQCDNPQAHFEVGLEFDHQVTVFYHHQSWYRCGGPFNNKPELYVDHIGIEKKWGGK